jgi:hypothetical protein
VRAVRILVDVLLALILIAVGSPWIAAIAYLWPRIPRDGALPRSAGELLRQRYLVR